MHFADNSNRECTPFGLNRVISLDRFIVAQSAPIGVHAAFPGVLRGAWPEHDCCGDLGSSGARQGQDGSAAHDIGKCWIFELDRGPASARALLVYFGGGTLILAITALCAWLRRQREINSRQPVIDRQQALREPVSQRR